MHKIFATVAVLLILYRGQMIMRTQVVGRMYNEPKQNDNKVSGTEKQTKETTSQAAADLLKTNQTTQSDKLLPDKQSSSPTTQETLPNEDSSKTQATTTVTDKEDEIEKPLTKLEKQDDTREDNEESSKSQAATTITENETKIPLDKDTLQKHQGNANEDQIPKRDSNKAERESERHLSKNEKQKEQSDDKEDTILKINDDNPIRKQDGAKEDGGLNGGSAVETESETEIDKPFTILEKHEDQSDVSKEETQVDDDIRITTEETEREDDNGVQSNNGAKSTETESENQKPLNDKLVPDLLSVAEGYKHMIQHSTSRLYYEMPNQTPINSHFSHHTMLAFCKRKVQKESSGTPLIPIDMWPMVVALKSLIPSLCLLYYSVDILDFFVNSSMKRSGCILRTYEKR